MCKSYTTDRNRNYVAIGIERLIYSYQRRFFSFIHLCSVKKLAGTASNYMLVDKPKPYVQRSLSQKNNKIKKKQGKST